MIKRFLIVLFFIFGDLFSHEVDLNLIDDSLFKEGVVDLCGGHGLMHLKPTEIKALCSMLSEDLEFVEEIQEGAKSDQFLGQLTRLIIWMELDSNIKEKLLRKSYEISINPPDGKEEWPGTISLLVERDLVLTENEIRVHSESEDEYLKEIAKRKIAKRKRSRDDQRLAEDSRGEENKSEGLLWVKSWPFISAIVLFTFSLVLWGTGRFRRVDRGLS